MDSISWEETQKIAHNMFKATDNPDELLMLYLFKMHSLLLNIPVELHHHLAQSLINTGMFNDPVLKNLYSELFNDEVSDVKQYDVLTHTMPKMLEAYGGHRRSKINKRKNKRAGNGDSENSNALVPAAPNPGALVEASRGKKPSLEIEVFDDRHGTRAWDFGSVVNAQIVINPMYPHLIEEQKSIEKECKEKQDILINERNQELEKLEKNIEQRKTDIEKKFNSEVNRLYKQIGVDLLFWLFGCLIIYLLKQTGVYRFAEHLGSKISDGTSKACSLVFDPKACTAGLSSSYLIFIAEYIFLAGVIGGLIKSFFVDDYSLAVSDIMAESTTKGKALKLTQYHNGIHIAKLIKQSSQLPNVEDIWSMKEYQDIKQEMETKKEVKTKQYEDLILKLNDDCIKRLKEIRDELIKMGKDTVNIEINKQQLMGNRSEQQLIGDGNKPLLDNKGGRISRRKKTRNALKSRSVVHS